MFIPPGDGGTPPAGGYPVMVFCNGLDSMKEMLVRLGLPRELARRGIATLCVDQPGTGASLRERAMPAIHDSERWASAAVDYLETRNDVDASRIGMSGVSLGGYYAPRATAFEKRFKLCAVWGGANYNWGELQKRRLQREGENPRAPLLGSRPVGLRQGLARGVHGLRAEDDPRRRRRQDHGALPRHPRGRTIGRSPMEFAVPPEYENAINSPDRHFKIFSRAEGGSSHAGADNEAVPANYIADWVADRL